MADAVVKGGGSTTTEKPVARAHRSDQFMVLERIERIVFASAAHERLLEHARRKLRGEFRSGEERERKAYGLLGGRLSGSRMYVSHVFPLIRNLRYEPHVKPVIDGLMSEVAFRSETPLERRGWVADPIEISRAEQACDAAGVTLFGSYHVHRVAWDHDPIRDTCTEIDTRLAEGSGLWMLIVSMVDPVHPILRAFFEGRNDREARVELRDKEPVMMGTEHHIMSSPVS